MDKPMPSRMADGFRSDCIPHDEENPTLAPPPQKRLKVEEGIGSHVGSKECIFCKKNNKYMKGSKSREPLNELVQLGYENKIDATACGKKETILVSAISKNSTSISYFHRSCRREHSRNKPFGENLSEVDGIADDMLRYETFLENDSKYIQNEFNQPCIFCNKINKYLKGTRSRETLLEVGHLENNKMLSEVATKKGDENIISALTKEGAKHFYHRTCQIAYRRKRSRKTKQADSYDEREKLAYNKLYEFVRNDLLQNPRVMPQTHLVEKLCFYLEELGHEVKDSSKKTLQYFLKKEFGPSLKFFNIDGKVYIVPENLTYQSLLEEYVRTKNSLEDHITASTNTDTIPITAKTIKEDLNHMENPHVWPPSPQELDTNYLTIPTSLTNFLKCLIGDSTPRADVVVWSIAQDIIYASSRGTILTPKHVLLQMTCKTLTGNVQLITILNRLGHGCSYSKLLEIDTALCLHKLNTVSEGEIPLPSSVHAGISTVLAYDNIDRIEETLSGGGTSHRVNGIVVQNTSSTCLPQRQVSVIKRKQRSIRTSVPPVHDFIVGKRVNPPAIATLTLPQTCLEAFKEAQDKNLLWIVSRMQNENCQNVSSWTGFNILVRNNVEIQADTVAYLPSINSPATEMTTVHEILNQSLKIKKQLELGEVTLVLDQAIFAKAIEISWCYPHTFKDIFIMMGGFHIICNLLSIIGKLFGDAGLADLAVEIGCTAHGSIQNVLQGKHYNRGVRLHKCIYEAFMRIIYRQFLDDLKSNFPEEYADMEELNVAIRELCNNTCNETFTSAIKHDKIMKITDLFNNYQQYLRHGNGPLSSYWMMYLELVELLLGLIRSNREGNWLLFLTCIQNMIPWCFSMDKVNYSRYLAVNFAEMTNLCQTHPDISKHLEDGGFSVQLGSENPFSRIPVDQTLEETVNKDTQTPGGTKGFSLKSGAVEKYYINAEYRASALRQLRENLNVASKFSHSDLHLPRIKKDEMCVSTAVQLLENEWSNPFETNPSDIISLSTGRAVPVDVQHSLLSVKEKGQDAYEKFKKDRLEKGEGFFEPLKKINIKTFSTISATKKSGKNKDIIIKSDRKLFASMVLIAEGRRLNMLDVFSHPLGPLPWSISNPDGTMKKTMKSALGKYLENLVDPSDGMMNASATVIDGMALIQKLQGENKSFDQLSEIVLNHVLRTAFNSSRVDIVFDIYKSKSIKNAERQERGSDSGIIYKNVKGGHKIIKWRSLLQSGESKNNFIKFLSESWQEETNRKKIGNKTLYVTCSDKCLKITGDSVLQVAKLASSQEEADSRMMLHIKDAIAEFPNVICASDDTDVLIVAMYVSSTINENCNIYIKRGSSGRIRLIDIKKLVAVVGSNVTLALPGLHAWTGCDTVSAFSGQGKIKALKLLQANKEYCLLFSRLGNAFTISDADQILIQKFTCALYSRNTKVEKVNELRYNMFKSRQGQVDSAQLPPCEDCLNQHCKRANYQAAIWKRCLENYPEIPGPEEHGWMLDKDGELKIKWMTGAPAPETVLQLLSCSCAKACQLPSCTCIANKLNCTNACKLKNCENWENEKEDEIQDSNLNLNESFGSDEEDCY